MANRKRGINTEFFAVNRNGGAGLIEARVAVKNGRHLTEECLIAAYSKLMKKYINPAQLFN